MKSVVIVLSISLVALVLSACSSAPQPLSMNINMSEFAFTPNVIEAKVGQQVTLNLVNDGALEHEIMFGRNMMMGDAGQPNGYETDMFMMANMQPTVTFGEGMSEGMDMGEGEMGMTSGEHGGYMVSLPGMGGQTAQMTFTVTEDMLGEWEFGCFAQEGAHYEQGMHGTMVVTK
jgi:plastocyanin